MQRWPLVKQNSLSNSIESNFFSSAAGLNLTEPCSTGENPTYSCMSIYLTGCTGIGGDMFCLFYDAKTKNVSALNGSGRAGAKCTLELIRNDLGFKVGECGEIPMTSVHSVTVPGAPAGWVDTVEKFGSGKLSLEQVLAPAIELGENGFPVHELSSTFVRMRLSDSNLALIQVIKFHYARPPENLALYNLKPLVICHP
jgi:gamma-glutamyltranspeptidase / glutathione hydrolase